MKQFLQKPNASEKMIKWVIELSNFHIKFPLRMAIKGKVLANFIVESTCTIEASLKDIEASQKPPPTWTLHIDGPPLLMARGHD